jgi:glycosidase
MPIFPSPSYHGYDVTDYRAVNPDYGTMEDFEAFLAAAHERGIAVLIDLVINHTSVEHPGSSPRRPATRTAPTGTCGRTPPTDLGPWGQQVWHERDGRWYFGLFWEGMPDLDLENPAVTAEVEDIARFWLEDVGVDGYRLDAARHLIEEGPVMADTPGTVAWLERFTALVHGVAPEAMVLGEVWSPTLDIARYVPAAMDLGFEFNLPEAGGVSLQEADATALRSAMERVRGAYPDDQYAVFLTNHDMDRFMSVVGGDVTLGALGATYLLTSPGVPFVYYGEEVGLQGTKPDERIRTPMPWNDDPPGLGFTTGTPWEPPDPGYDRFNVAAETDAPGSLLSHYRTLIHLRNGSPALRFGDYAEVETGNRAVFAYLRSAGDDHVLVVLNFSPDPVTDYALDLATADLDGMRGVVTVVGPGAVPPEITARGGFLAYRPVASLPGYAGLVVRLTEEEQPPPPTTTTTTTTLPDVTEEDVAVAEAFFAGIAEGPLAWRDVVADGAFVTEDGQAMDLGTEIPPGVGVFDWDGDDRITLTDLIAQQFAWAAVSGVGAGLQCAPGGGQVVCTLDQQDVFFDRAGVTAPPVTQSFVVRDGEIVEIGSSRSDVDDPTGAAWLEQVFAYQQWVFDTYPDEHDDLFLVPCCGGDEFPVMLSPGAIARHGELLEEWVEAGG